MLQYYCHFTGKLNSICEGGVSIDIKTIIILDALGNLLGALLVYTYSKHHFSRVIKYHWYSQILFGITFSLFIASFLLFNHFFIAVANATLLYGGLFELFSIMHLTNRVSEKKKKVMIIFLAIMLGIQAVMVLIIDLSNIRIGIMTLVLSFLCFQMAYLLLKQKNCTGLQKLVGIFFLFATISLILRALQALDLHNKYELLTPGVAQTLTFVSLFAIMIVSGLGIPLLSKERADVELLIAATHDELTGIYNRKYFFEEVEKEIEYAKRKKYSFSMLMIDIDHFKNINDTYGHQKGDLVLQEFARMLSGALRKYDLFGRIGGEEFLVFVQDVSKEEAYKIAEKLRAIVEMNDVEGIHNTISLGVYSVEPNIGIDFNFDEILRQCDLALYEAKNAGRNRTIQKVMK